jgi:hypothetical protein
MPGELFDFFIQEIYRGSNVCLPPLPLETPETQKEITLHVPPLATYMDVDSLEEEESLGNPCDSPNQEIDYYNADKDYMGSERLECVTCTYSLIQRLELVFSKDDKS